MSAKKFRMQKFFYPGTEKGLILPIDHGLTVGSLKGLGSLKEIETWITDPSITGIICHKGMAEKLTEHELLYGKGLMIHINGMSSLSLTANSKVRLTSVESAIILGADAISFQVNFDGTNDAENLSQMGAIVDEASAYGMPVLAMVYDKVKTDEKKTVARILHLTRAAFELGCSAVKIAPPVEIASTLKEITKMIPVFVAGGSLVSKEELLSLSEQVVTNGGSGLCVGRNIFERTNYSFLKEIKSILLANPIRPYSLIKEAAVVAH